MPTDPNEHFRVGDDFTEILRLGLLHIPTGRFLTAEVFNSEINVSGTTLRRRQVWSILVQRGCHDTVYMLGHLGRFLSADKDGKVNAAAKVPGVDERFLLEFSPQATGEWAFRSEAHGFYLSGTETQISCFSKTPVWWSVRLAIHSQVHLRHLFRSHYLRLLPNGSELRADQSQPWGSESSLWLEQPAMAPAANGFGKPTSVGRGAVARLGRVALRCQTGQYLRADGGLSNEMDDCTLFALELRPGSPRSYAFRDSSGAYLSATGPGTIRVKAASSSAGKEEVFGIERAALQVGVLAHNNKFASVKQGSEISANQHEQDETAIFQLEYIGGKGFNSSEATTAPLPLPQTPGGDVLSPWQGGLVDGSTAANSSRNLATNGVNSPFFFLVTGFWRLRSHSGKLWDFSPSAAVQNTASDGDRSSLFEMLTVAEENETIGPGQVVLRSGGQTISARKLGAIFCSGRSVNETEPPPVGDLFRLVLVNRPTVALVSMLTGGFLCRSKQTGLDCCGVVCERVQLRLTKHKSFFLFLGDRKPVNSQLVARSDGLLQVKQTNLSPDDDLECVEPEVGTEFLLYFLGNGRIVLRSLNGPIPGLALVKAEAKGDVKVDSASDILTNHIWEI